MLTNIYTSDGVLDVPDDDGPGTTAGHCNFIIRSSPKRLTRVIQTTRDGFVDSIRSAHKKGDQSYLRLSRGGPTILILPTLFIYTTALESAEAAAMVRFAA
jgi:hypothetical protein